MGSLVLLNEMGDLEIHWDSNNDEAVKKMIEAKMAKGMIFYIKKPILGIIPARRQLKADWSGEVSIDDLKSRKITVQDKDIEELFATGKVHLTRSQTKNYDTLSRAKTADEVMHNDCVGMRPLSGG